MKKLYPLFLQNIQKHNLISNNDTIISALSGGKDSVTLILLLKRLQKDIPFVLKAAYFNHRIRKDVLEEEGETAGQEHDPPPGRPVEIEHAADLVLPEQPLSSRRVSRPVVVGHDQIVGIPDLRAGKKPSADAELGILEVDAEVLPKSPDASGKRNRDDHVAR